jgi:hypothetical protein
MEQKPPSDRDLKLAQALRANLKRRKQAGRVEPVKPPPEPDRS